MDRKQLRAFVAVAEQHSFSAGARALGTVQSNVSAHIARLEKELGVTLIDRSTNLPTDEGRAVLERAREIQEELAGQERSLAGAAGASIAASAPPPGCGGGKSRGAPQVDLFSPAELAVAEIASLDIDAMTPIQALNKLAEIKRRLQAR